MKKYITDYEKNQINFVIRDLTRPQKKAIREILRGIFRAGKPILRNLSQNQKISAKSAGKKFGFHLENVKIAEKINEFCDQKVLPKIAKNTVVAYDLSDIAKPFSKKMDGISRVFDGSKRTPENGFFLHGVGVNGVLIRLKIHDPNRHFLPEIRREIILDIAEKCDNKAIFALDRGNDSKSFFVDLNRKNLKFIVRLKKNRKLILSKTGEICPVESLPDGRFEVFLHDKNNRKIDTKNKYFVIVKTGKKGVIRLLCSENLRFLTNKEVVSKYLKRWGVEKSFREIKTQFSLEKIRVLKKNRIENLVVLTHFASAISTILYQKIRQTRDLFSFVVFSLFEKFTKTRSLSDNPNAFISFLKSVFPAFLVRSKSPPSQSQYALF